MAHPIAYRSLASRSLPSRSTRNPMTRARVWDARDANSVALPLPVVALALAITPPAGGVAGAARRRITPPLRLTEYSIRRG
jgi:hypothetical protein